MKHFCHHTKPTKNNPVLLLLDNHCSHETYAALKFAKENGIIMLSFPPHTSHKAQPCDVSPFSPLRTYYNKALISLVSSRSKADKAITIYDLPRVIAQVYSSAFTDNNIITGFKKPGIWPFNRFAFNEADFEEHYVFDMSDHEYELSATSAELSAAPTASSTTTKSSVLPLESSTLLISSSAMPTASSIPSESSVVPGPSGVVPEPSSVLSKSSTAPMKSSDQSKTPISLCTSTASSGASSSSSNKSFREIRPFPKMQKTISGAKRQNVWVKKSRILTESPLIAEKRLEKEKKWKKLKFELKSDYFQKKSSKFRK